MKLKLKILILSIGFIGLSLITNDVVAQDTIKVTASSVYNDIKHAAEINSPKIGNAISSIARGLKVTADQVWYILVKQQKVYSISILIGIFITIFSWLHFWYRMRKAIEANWGTIGSAHYELSCVLTAAIAILGTLACSVHFVQMITGFINPEFGAMQSIVEIAQSLK